MSLAARQLTSAYKALFRDRRGMEVSMLVSTIILVVFVLVALGAVLLMWKRGNVFSGEDSVCSGLMGIFRGCS